MKIRDARAVITGGASGLGLAVARHLVAAGGKVVLLDVQEGPGRVAVDELGRDATFQRCDVTSEAEVNVAIEAAHAWLGGLNLLVNCAEVIAAFEGQIGQAAYSATKAAVAGMTLPIARELARFGIRCVAIAPGIFHTPMMDGMPKEVQDSLGAQVPFPSRLGRPEEFAELVASVFEIPMLNGTTIRLDGAIRMQPK